MIECDVFADALPKSAEGRTGAYVAAVRRCSARVAQLGEAAPSHTTLLAAEGCVLHKAHAALMSASVAATRAATEELHEGCSLLAARIELPQGLDLSQAAAHLVAVKSCTLPLCVRSDFRLSHAFTLTCGCLSQRQDAVLEGVRRSRCPRKRERKRRSARQRRRCAHPAFAASAGPQWCRGCPRAHPLC